MGWFTRKKDFEEDADILAEDFDEEFDHISEALNSIPLAARVQATAKTVFGAAYSDVAGAVAEIEVTQPSLLVAIATFDVSVGDNDLFTGNLEIDGVIETQEACLAGVLGAGASRAAVTQTYVKALNIGAHEVKMIGKRNGEASIFDAENTGITYFVLPNPEP